MEVEGGKYQARTSSRDRVADYRLARLLVYYWYCLCVSMMSYEMVVDLLVARRLVVEIERTCMDCLRREMRTNLVQGHHVSPSHP